MSQYRILADAVCEAVSAGRQFPAGIAESVIGLVESHLTEAEQVDLVVTLAPLIHGCDFRRYHWYCEQLAGGKSLEALDEEWTNTHTAKFSKEVERCFAEIDTLEAQAPEAFRKFRMHSDKLAVWFGADVTSVREIASLFGRKSARPQEYPDLPESLHGSICPVSIEPRPYDHALHGFALRLLTALSGNVRWHRDVLRLLGQRLEQLFSPEDGKRGEHFVVRQATYLVQDHLSRQPDDVVALAWLGELEAVQGNLKRAFELAHRLWKQRNAWGAADYLGLMTFLVLSSSGDTNYISLGYRSGHPDSCHLADLWDTWEDQQACLVSAVVRRAFQTSDYWNTDTVSFIDSWGGYLPDEEPETAWVPPEAWIALAEAGCSCPGVNYEPAYYVIAWENALLAGRLRRQGEYIVLAAPYVLANHLVSREGELSFADVLEALVGTASTPSTRQQAARIVDKVDELLGQLQSTKVTPRDKVALVHAKREFADDRRERRAHVCNQAELQEVLRHVQSKNVSIAKQSVGDNCWKTLHKSSRQGLEHAVQIYQQLHEGVGDEADFGTPVELIAKVLVGEFSRRLRRIAVRSPQVKRTCGPVASLGDLVRFLQDVTMPDARDVQRILLASKMDIRGLSMMEKDLDELRQVRNRSAHNERVDRELAAQIYGKWINTGRMREFLLALPR